MDKFSFRDIIDQILRPNLPYVVKSNPTDSGIDPRVLCVSDPGSYVCEQYRKVITNFEFTAAEKGMKTFLFTSASRFEGKTTTSVNLAALLSTYENKKILLIDADLRKAAIHRLFGLPRKPGLTSVILEHMDLDEAVHKLKETPNLHILTAGPSITSPVELFASESFKAFLAQAKYKFDFVLLDTPPLLAVTDACVISKAVDGVIVIASAYITPEPAVKEAVSLLQNVKANIVGTLLTHTKEQGGYYYSKYYKYYKDYSSGASEEHEKEA